MDYLLYYKKDKIVKKVGKDRVIKDLYNQKAVVPTLEQLKKSKHKVTVQNVVDSISQVNDDIPLYDEYSKNMYIISKENVYNRVVYQHYRFPTKNMLEKFKIKFSKLVKPEVETDSESLGDKSTKVHYTDKHTQIFKDREFRKLKMMIAFLESFNLEILENTYVKVFYYYANEVGKNITECVRPSFKPHFKHITPYYKRGEVINMALNMELIKPSKEYFTQDKIDKLCKLITQNDVKASTITAHQLHIVKNSKIGVIQHYSMQGSYFMNQYLRGFTTYKYKNEYLENSIRSMWELILSSPEFDKSYILYRFIKNDDHISSLKIGDTYMAPSFISTTRDPFYRSEMYKFGYILIKIKIPSKTVGIGLCVESMSHFPEEQEIILPPLTKLKLVKKDSMTSYFHTDDVYETKIKTRYEFEYLGKGSVKFVDKPIYNKKNTVDFLQMDVIDTVTVSEKINRFTTYHCMPMYQFSTFIGKREYTVVVENYDSTGAYKDFYASVTSNGFLMYSMVDNYTEFTAEIGDNYMYVNYYFRYSTKRKECSMKDEDFLNFISSVAHYFEIRKVVIYADYSFCELDDTTTFRGGNYCVDFYNYFKYNVKRYSKSDTVEIRPMYSYHQLDRLKTISPKKILKKDDRDELYQIYSKCYTDDSKYDTISGFYIWIVENYCVFASDLIKHTNRIFNNHDNPFSKDYYILDPYMFLYNRQLIESPKVIIDDDEEVTNKNTYRTNIGHNDRVPQVSDLR